ncbi:ElyC/SanA/YdcF family protein [Thermodesulfobacteriota bacterium]
MQKNSTLKGLLSLLNLFAPGVLNLFSGRQIIGAVLLITSFFAFFFTPYLPILIVRSVYIILFTLSYLLYFKEGQPDLVIPNKRAILAVSASFLTLSIFSISLTHVFKADTKHESLNMNSNAFVYVLGTRPFKLNSTEKMLKMNDEDLFSFYDNDIHPFFRRLKSGIKKVSANNGLKLIVSAGKNQKKISQRILSQAGIDGKFFSCKSTKEEVTSLKKYLNSNGLKNAAIIMVSDDYHAFRALFYSKLSNIDDVSFLATSYKYSTSSMLKIYSLEISQLLLSYLRFVITLTLAA